MLQLVSCADSQDANCSISSGNWLVDVGCADCHTTCTSKGRSALRWCHLAVENKMRRPSDPGPQTLELRTSHLAVLGVASNEGVHEKKRVSHIIRVHLQM